MKDWLDQEYGVGDLVLYAAGSGRSITMVLARVVSIYKVYRDPDKWGWTRIGVDDDPPFKREWNREIKNYVDTSEREETELRVQVQPLNSSRWTQHHKRTRYIDTRTGKGIDWSVVDKKTGLYRHCDGGYFENPFTGEKVHEYEYHSHPELRHFRSWDKSSLPYPWKRVERRFKDYVQEIKEEPKPVTLTVTENIVRWSKKLQPVDESEDVW